jgi:hypothetical protein
LPDEFKNGCAAFLEFSELKKPQLANNVKVRDPYEWQFILSYPS